MYAVIGESIRNISGYSFVDSNTILYKDESGITYRINKNYFEPLTDEEYKTIIKSDNPGVERKYLILKRKAIKEAKEDGLRFDEYDIKKLETLVYEAAVNNAKSLNPYDVVKDVGNQ